MSRELIAQLYSSDDGKKRAAVYRFLFDRRHDLVDELKKAASFEANEDIAVFMAQVCLNLETFFRDTSLERQILELLNKEGGIYDISVKMWDYLITTGTSSMLIGVMGVMGETIPTNAQDFMEACLNHLDPEVRAMACQVAINSGRPTHFAHVLSLIADPDPIVSETAFRVIKDLPPDQMVIILDYALGSPDEWVLQNVATFLPLIINRELRKVIAKHQYHSHPMVSKKSREALKELDAIPVTTKKQKEEKATEQELAKEALEDKGEEKVLSLKEQMELKKQQKLEDERRQKEEEEQLNSELAKVDSQELENFGQELKDFGREAEGSASQNPSEPDEHEQFVENADFEEELNALENVDLENVDTENVDIENIDLENMELNLEPVEEAVEAEGTAPVVSDQVEEANDLVMQSADAKQSETEADEPLAIIDLAAAGEELDALIKSNESQTDEQNSLLVNDADDVVVIDTTEEPAEDAAEATELKSVVSSADSAITEDVAELMSEVSATKNVQSPDASTEATAAAIAVETVAPDVTNGTSVAIASAPVAERVLETPVAESNQTVAAEAAPVHPSATDVASPSAAPAAQEEVVGPGMIKVEPDSAAQYIMARYPSFIVMPYSSLFKPGRPEVVLKALQLTVDHLVGYLNLCFIQSCLFFATPSDMLERSIKDCLKGHLVGPIAIRCLHNFALAMKQSRENPIFFTFTLSQVFSESSDTNPLMMLRELAEYLKDPIAPLEETIPQAVEGMTEILRGCKAIMNNILVMKAPRGAKEPFADLSGPLAQVLSADKRPALDLPAGEVILISRDGGEALGLFPFFKYSKRRVHFARPDEAEMKILLERLEIEIE